MKYKDGRMYIGGWSQGKREGKGVEYLRGNKFIGHFKDGRPQGYGVYQWRDTTRPNQSRSGDLEAPTKHDGQIYWGEFKSGRKEGIGYW